MCPECGKRPIRTRQRCSACYERARSKGLLDDLPRLSYYRHTEESCPICDEVTALRAYGWDARTINKAINRNPEYVLRHLRAYNHPLADLFVPMANEASLLREHRRKASA